MPGRYSGRNSITTRLTSQPLNKSRRSTTSPTIVIPDEGAATSLRNQICTIFSDAQKTTIGHRKLVVGLRKIQEQCIFESPSLHGKKRQERESFSEDDFNVEFARCVIRLMGVRKSESVGDRLMRFIGVYLRYTSEKDANLMPETESEDMQSFPETSTSRLTMHILSMLLQFLMSKEKTVRYRATQLVAHIINSLDFIDDEYYHLLKMGLLKRIRDKESNIRVQAVMGLGRLAGNEDDGDNGGDDSDDDEVSGLLEKLLDVLQNDPSAEVRRSLLLNLPLTPITLPYLLERARDLDSLTRRALYSRLLPALGDFRHLSLSMREKLLRWGLRDRDEKVRRATARLFRERWIEDCTGSRPPGENGNPTEVSLPTIDGLLELLERIDIVNSGIEEGIAGEAMKEFWEGRPDYQEKISFADPFWDNLTPESVFVARTMNDFYHVQSNHKYEATVEEKMPELTKLAFILQKYSDILVERLQEGVALGQAEEEGDTAEQEFIVEQLLYIARTLDFTDEVGRRKMFGLLREILGIAVLPDEITKLAIEVLRDVCGKEVAGEKEFCGVVLEAIAEVHDAIETDALEAENEDESFHSARSELSERTPTQPGHGNDADESRAIREVIINMKCLHIAQCMLQNIEGGLQKNMHLVTMLNNLVVPAVRSHEAPIRERGLLCLGLCCLLDKNLADENLTLFMHCFTKGHDVLQVTAIHILADVLETHPSLLTAQDVDVNLQQSIQKIFVKGMKAQHAPEVQSAAVTALCKLMLTSIIKDEDLLKQAVICFFDSATKERSGVRQALSYSLPVYCYSRRENMERMANVAGEVIREIVDLSEELEESEEMVGIGMVGNMLVDWTDARRLVVQDGASVGWDEAGRKEIKAVNGDIHLIMAESLLVRALNRGCSKEEKKGIISMLGKLYITVNSTVEKLHSINELVTEAIDNKIACDAASRTALNKLHLALRKALDEAGDTKKDADESALPSVGDELTTIKEQGDTVLPSVGDVKMEVAEIEGLTQDGNSILEELLNDDD